MGSVEGYPAATRCQMRGVAGAARDVIKGQGGVVLPRLGRSGSTELAEVLAVERPYLLLTRQ